VANDCKILFLFVRSKQRCPREKSAEPELDTKLPQYYVQFNPAVPDSDRQTDEVTEFEADTELPQCSEQFNPTVPDRQTDEVTEFEADTELPQCSEQFNPTVPDRQTDEVTEFEADTELPQRSEQFNPTVPDRQTDEVTEFEADTELPQCSEQFNPTVPDRQTDGVTVSETGAEFSQTGAHLNITMGYLVPAADGNSLFVVFSEDGSVSSTSVMSQQDMAQLLYLSPAGNDVESQVNDGLTVQHQVVNFQPTPEDDVQSNVEVQQNRDSEGSRSKRRGIRNVLAWKKNVRRNRRQAGKPYVNSKGVSMRARSSKNRTSCEKCKFKCAEKIIEDMRREIHSSFWAMNDDLKFSFFEQTTTRAKAKRRCAEDSRKKYSFKYYLLREGQKTRVCKKFYLSCLDISQRRVSYYHEHIRTSAGTSRQDLRGRHPKKCLPTRDRQLMWEHINSFPRVVSHNRRAKSSKEYLEPGLNLQKMYDMYKTWCELKQVQPVKFNFYRTVFKTDFNIAVLKPKNDRCDLCEEFDTAQKNDNKKCYICSTSKR